MCCDFHKCDKLSESCHHFHKEDVRLLFCTYTLIIFAYQSVNYKIVFFEILIFPGNMKKAVCRDKYDYILSHYIQCENKTYRI